ncbi:hypothetical protein F5Y17DRAFT_453206 [Xylariaceae sp. FL0594]|nr:hypothetical protein F5Y17DRAFT_453206 [Xylariaceae sp. FL0594]
MSALRTTILRAARTPTLPRTLPRTTLRPFHQTASAHLPPYKDDMDRESLKPKAHEYTQSGTDEETAAEHPDAAFNPNKTSPEEEKRAAGEGAVEQGKQGGSPLESSPADKTFAQGGEGKGSDEKPEKAVGDKEKKRSGGHHPTKAGKTT